MNKKEDIIEIDLIKLAQAILRRLWAVILAALIFAGSFLGYTVAFVKPTYVASTLLYVNNSMSVGSASISISSATLAAAQELVSTYIVILKARTSLNAVIEYSGIDRNYNELKNMISASAVDSTEIFQVNVTSTDPKEAEVIANAIAKVLPTRIAEIVEGSSVEVVDYAVVPSARSSPSYTKNTAIGFMLGVILSVGIIVLRELFDNVIREEKYLSETYQYPVLASIPNINNSKSGSGHYGKYGYYSSKNSSVSNKS